ncbi:hypothetical protein [Streptomyces sp. HD]|uniref:hypothetical protein n=1 Tax=Streptomyces sp. HD TaxID=3020892 RepID=UPI00232F0268|nr:hypothetical protein [Streptomyces sp. HD]MDC0768572.1 hypothetical protein [Streptomyces sp. HD]
MCTDRRRHRAGGRGARNICLAAATVAMAALALTGCAEQRTQAVDTGRPQGSRATATAGSPAADGLRKDEEPVRARFPEFGDFAAVVWKGEALGQNDRSSVPGPTDVRMSGVVRLTEADATRLQDTYTWQGTSAQPDLPTDLRAQLPSGARWQTSTDFTRAVTGDRYTATFHADLDRKVLVFDAVNPEKKG